MKSSFISSNQLLEKTRGARAEEKRVLADLLKYLLEIERRKAYLDWGYPSLFTFLTDDLKYDKACAYRRLLAVRALRQRPELSVKIESGSISLSNLCEAQRVIQAESKARAVSDDEKSKIFSLIENKSQTQADRVLVEAYPQTVLKLRGSDEARPTEKALPANRVEIRWVIPSELAEKIEKLKDLRSQADFDRDPVRLLEWLVDQGLERLDPVRREARRQERREKRVLVATASQVSSAGPEEIERTEKLGMTATGFAAEPSSAAKPTKQSSVSQFPIRFRRGPIPIRVRDQIKSRDSLSCAYVSAVTGRRCGSSHAIEIDHIVPVAAGGEGISGNLRVFCDRHNRARGMLML